MLAGYISETIKLGALGLSPYRTFVVDELKEATDNFNALHLIGEGSYGQVPLILSYSLHLGLVLSIFACYYICFNGIRCTKDGSQMRLPLP